MKKGKIKYSIKIKIIAVVTVLMITVAAANTLVFINQQEKMLHEEKQKNGFVFVKNFARGAEYGLLTLDIEELKSLAGEALNNPDAEYAFIADKTGNPLASRSVSKEENIQYTFIENTSSGEPEFRITRNKKGEQFYEFSMPVLSVDQSGVSAEDNLFSQPEEKDISRTVIGYVGLGISTRDIHRTIIQAKRSAVIITAAIVLIVAFIFVLLTGAALAPVKRLVDATEKIASGCLDSRVEVKTKDELGLLAFSFNKMVEDLQKTTVSKDYVNNIFGIMTDPLIVINASGIIEMANRAAGDMFELPIEELKGNTMPPFIFLSTSDATEDSVTDPLDWVKINNVEAYCLSNKVNYIPVLISGSAQYNSENKLEYVVCSIHDISTRKKSERLIEEKNAELGDANQELRQRELELKNMLEDLQKTHEELKNTQNRLLQSEKLASIGQLSAGIAHEINNPLGFIKSNIYTLEKYISKIFAFYSESKSLPGPVSVETLNELAQKNKLDFIFSDLESLFADINDGTERIKKIVLDLKLFSRESEESESPVDLNEVLESVLNIAWNELKYKAEICKEYSEIPPVMGINQQLCQVFINIAVNAAQAIEKKGTITLRTYVKDTGVFVEIEDTGPGIPEDIKNKIFDPFFTTKPEGQGTGLGLSICYEIIKKFNGDIEVESQPGKGTKFTVSFPKVG